MGAWTMRFREGKGGTDLWPECQRHRVAAITYSPLDKTDLHKHKPFEPHELWNELASAQKYSLSKFAYEMKRDDIIYVRYKGELIAKGLVKGPYFFDFNNAISDPSGEYVPWAHQRRVRWQKDFRHISAEDLGPAPYTVWKLTSEQIAIINRRIKEALNEKELDPEKTDIDQQDELERYESKRDISKILNELRNLRTTDSEQIEVHNKVYKRDNKTIAQLKRVRRHKCQICGLTIRRKNGKLYIEAAHITPKKQKGTELPSNIIILCPNHHKEFDLGEKVILKRDDKMLIIMLNGHKYSIDLKI